MIHKKHSLKGAGPRFSYTYSILLMFLGWSLFKNEDCSNILLSKPEWIQKTSGTNGPLATVGPFLFYLFIYIALLKILSKTTVVPTKSDSYVISVYNC